MNLVDQDTQPRPKSYLIPLTNGMSAIVDAQDYEHVNKFTWVAQWSSACSSFYALRRFRENGKKGLISMHREIMGAPKGMLVDHIEPGQTLDNRRCNLRVATSAESIRNRERGRNNTSGFKGVRHRPGRSGWIAEIQLDGRKYYLGRFGTKEEAHAAYCEAAYRLHGEFARVS